MASGLRVRKDIPSKRFLVLLCELLSYKNITLSCLRVRPFQFAVRIDHNSFICLATMISFHVVESAFYM